MPDRFFLNALDPDKHTLEVPGAGGWRSEGTSRDFLVKYAKDIKLEQLKDPRVVHSVPSVFARPIQFYQALSDRKNPLHDVVVSQWRGLLAVFALQNWLNLTPTTREYRIPPAPATSPTTGGTGGVGDLHITTILRNQLPRPESDWERWWLLYCDGQLIGATSPWTVVYTPAEYRCPDTIPWQREGLLIDAIDYYDSGKKTSRSYELALLLRWVELVREQHKKDKWGIADRMAGDIDRELGDWMTALGKYRDTAISVPALADYPLVSEAPYRHFLLPPREGDGPPPPVSDLILNASKKVTDTLVFSRSGLSLKKRVYSSVFVDQVDLANLPELTGESGWRARNNQEIPLPYVIAEEAFFPPKLAELNLSDKALVRGTDELAIPLTPLFFKYFNHNDLTDRKGMLTVSATEQQVIVRLRLPWVGGEELTVEKTYDRNTDIVKVSGVTPALAVWPDFYAEDWLENFAIYSAFPDTNLLVAPVLGDGTVLTRTTNQSQELPWIWPNRKPPIGFALFHLDTGSGKSIAVGLALRRELPRPMSLDSNRTWEVAVDFGTSNTHVVVEEGFGYRKLPLRGRTTMLTDAEESLEYIAGSIRYPNLNVPGPPFVTLLTRGNATVPTVGGDGWRTAMEYNPYFDFSPDHVGVIQQFVHNVKWGSRGGGADSVQLQAYLRGVVRYIACEARAAGVGKLSFAWSYPLALPRGVIADMNSFWQNVGTSFSRPGAMTITAAEGCSESDAICRHLAAIEPAVLPVHAKALSSAVDVGGGSSDVGFWIENTLKDRVSLKLAGNDLLPPLRPLKGFVQELYEICSGGAQYLGELDTPFNERPAIMFNTLLTRAKDVSGNPCGFGDPRNHPVVKALFVGTDYPYGEPPWLFVRSLIYLFFSGIAFYLGLHARKLVTGISEINLYFGGMGSSLLAWIIGDGRKIEEILAFAFREGLERDEPDNKRVNIHVFGPAIDYSKSLPPKEEVAFGLLSPTLGVQGGAGVAGPQNTTILGELGWTGSDGEELDWDAKLTAEAIYNLNPPPNLESGYMAQFLTNVLPKYVEELSLDEKLKELQVESTRVQDNIRRAVIAEKTVLQPVLSCELKTAMEQYVSMALRLQDSGRSLPKPAEVELSVEE